MYNSHLQKQISTIYKTNLNKRNGGKNTLIQTSKFQKFTRYLALYPAGHENDKPLPPV